MTNTQLFPSTRSQIIVAPSSSKPPPAQYSPVDCDFTDDLEFASVYKIELEIQYWSEKGEAAQTDGVIANIVTETNKEEFLILDRGQRIRLDHLRELRISGRSRTTD